MKAPRSIVIIGLLGFIVTGCQKPPDLEKEKVSLIRTDQEFSQMSVDSGIAAAFHEFIAPNGRALPKFGHPITKEKYAELAREAAGKKPAGILLWNPTDAEVSASADMGYTTGHYEYVVTDSVGKQRSTYGYYISVWKKQDDGTWKFVLDAGNESPNPDPL